MSAEWPSVPISELCELITDCVNKTAKVVDGPTPYKMIRTTNVRDGWVDTINVRYVEEETYKKWTRRGEPKNGDVILTREAPLGEVGLLRDARGIFLGQRLVMYRANPTKLDNRFLLYSLLGHDLQAQIKAFGSGSTVEHMRVPDCEKLILQLPPLETQQKIGSILSTYDDLIENNTRRIKILEEMARMIYREWFVNFRFPGHEQVKMIDSPLGQIPEGWEVKGLGDVAQEMRRGINPEEVAPETPYFGLEHLPRRSLALTEWGTAAEVQSSKLLFNKGEILFGKIRPYFHKVGVAPVDGICSTDTIVIGAKDRLHFTLVLGCVSSDDFVSHATKTSQGTKMPRADWKVLVKYPVIIPTKQTLIKYNNHIDNALGMIQNLANRNRNLRQTRDLLLPKLISGEVVV